MALSRSDLTRQDVDFDKTRAARLQQSGKIRDAERYHEVYYKEPPRPESVPVEIMPNDIIIGCNSIEYSRNNLVKLNVRKFNPDGSPNNISMLFAGIARSGKSVTCGEVCLDNLVARFKEPFIVYDPKHEWGKHKDPSFEESGETSQRKFVDKLFSEIDGGTGTLKRQGYDLLRISPIFLDIKKVVTDRYISVTYSMIMQFYNRNPVEAARILCELIGLDTDNYSIELLQTVMRDKSIKDFKDLRWKIETKHKRLGFRDIPIDLDRKFRMALENKYISNNEEDGIDVLHEMKIRQGIGGVIVNGTLKTSNVQGRVDNALNATIKLIFGIVWWDCNAWHVEGDSTAILKSPNGVVMVFDEIDLLANDTNDSSTRDFVTFLLTKGGGAGLDTAAIGQEASLIYHELLSQLKIRFTSQVTKNNASAFRGIMPKEYLDPDEGILTHLRRECEVMIDGKKTGIIVSEWSYTDQEGHLELYMPFISRSNYAKRKPGEIDVEAA